MPRFGDLNPTLTNNPVWNWLIKTKISAWKATKASEHDFYKGATWCFDRFGQTTTQLADGRVIYIGGEHEDYYDPDFYIYNDVVVENTDKSLDIYTYPIDVFMPTDFHSATLLGDKIIIVGRLGYAAHREINDTPVYILDINTFAIEKISTLGVVPGWIFEHAATLMDDGKTLLITGGKNHRGENKSFCENINEWTLNTETWEWQLAKENNWNRWEYLRKDRGRNFLFDIRHTLWRKEANWLDGFEEHIEDLNKKLGYDPDISEVKSLYQPPVEFTTLPQLEDEYHEYRISINSVLVRYCEDSWGIQVCVEGVLSTEVIGLLKMDLFTKLTNLIKTEWELLDV